MRLIPKWSSLAAVAVLAAVPAIGMIAKPALAQPDSQQWQNDNAGQYGQPDWNSQQYDPRGNLFRTRGNRDQRQFGRNRNGGNCGNNGFRDDWGRGPGHYGYLPYWNRGWQWQCRDHDRDWQGRDRRWNGHDDGRGNGHNRRGHEHGNDDEWNHGDGDSDD